MDVNITYETLFDTLRKEKSSEELQPLEQNFYDDVSVYLLEKKSTYQQNKDSKTLQQIKNSKKIVKEIFERRQKKILLLAFNQGRTNVELATNKLLKEEAYFYQSILETVIKYNNLLKKSTKTNGEALEAHMANNNFDDSEGNSDFKMKEETPKSDKIKVEFLTNLPKFLGKDLESYGPYKKGDQISLPEMLANILVDKKRARKL